jgi:transcription-repair coupling factor (superfamily II helicase)
MRDMEIRGAGNILGPEQHGFIITVGFDLYSQLLEEAVRELKGQAPPAKEMQPNIELQVDAFISDQYVADARQKIDAYKRIISIRTLEDAEDVADEFVDRFGSIPDPVKNLLDIARLKVQAAKLGVTSIQQMRDQVTIKYATGLGGRIGLDRYILLGRRPEFKGRILAKGPKVTQFVLKAQELDARSLLRVLRELLKALQETPTLALH